MEYLFVKRLLQGDFGCSGVILTDQMKRFLIEIIATESDNLSIDGALEFFLKIEVYIDYEDRIILERNKQNALDQAPNADDLEELINSQDDFVVKLNKFYNDAMILIHFSGINLLLSRDIDNGIKDELFLKLQSSDLGFSDSYIKQVLELLLPDLSNSRESFIRAKTRLNGLRKYYIEQLIGKTIEIGLDKEIENRLESRIGIEKKSSSQAKIHQDVKRFVKLYGIHGLISFSLINQSSFCKIEPLYPNFNSFVLRLIPEVQSPIL